MKSILLHLEDDDHKALDEKKQKLKATSWEDFFLRLAGVRKK